AFEVDALQLANSKELLVRRRSERNDESRVLELLSQVQRDSNLLLHPFLVQCNVGAAEEHLYSAIVECRRDLTTPAIAWLQRLYIGKNLVPSRLKSWGKPQDEVIVLWRRLTDEQ